MVRRKFWLSLALTVPAVATSAMVMDWFGYTLDFPGIDWVGPVLGSVVFCPTPAPGGHHPDRLTTRRPWPADLSRPARR